MSNPKSPISFPVLPMVILLTSRAARRVRRLRQCLLGGTGPVEITSRWKSSAIVLFSIATIGINTSLKAQSSTPIGLSIPFSLLQGFRSDAISNFTSTASSDIELFATPHGGRVEIKFLYKHDVTGVSSTPGLPIDFQFTLIGRIFDATNTLVEAPAILLQYLGHPGVSGTATYVSTTWFGEGDSQTNFSPITWKFSVPASIVPLNWRVEISQNVTGNNISWNTGTIPLDGVANHDISTGTFTPNFYPDPKLNNLAIIPAFAGDPARISGSIVNGVPNGTAQIEASIDLGQTDPWETIATIILDDSGDGSFLEIQDIRPAAANAFSDFFRVRVEH